MENVDIAVIGGGPGGYPAAIRAAQLSASVALVEKEALGGTCLNWGCIPTKTLIATSSLYYRMQHAKRLGITPGRTSFDYAAMTERKDGVVQKLSQGVEMLLKGNGVKVFKGTASFASRNRLTITGGRKHTALEAKNIIIATGSSSAMPGFIPRSKRIMESRAFLDLTELPKSLLVLGGGIIGCEFACMAAQLGAKVTVVEMLDDIVPVLDPDIRKELRRTMEKELKIKILAGAPMQNIKATREAVNGTVDEKELSAECMLVSVGRVPVVDDLCPEQAGIGVAENGAIPVDADCRTNIANIFAIGDVTVGSTQLAHAATSEGITAAQNACRPRAQAAETLVPACVFTWPEIGSVGLSEAQAKAQGLGIETGKFMLAGLGKAMAVGETAGFVKWIADPATGQLLGAHAIGEHATELIAEATTAIRAELTVEELGRTIHCHPTFSESWMEAAHAVHGECIHAPPKRKR